MANLPAGTLLQISEYGLVVTLPRNLSFAKKLTFGEVLSGSEASAVMVKSEPALIVVLSAGLVMATLGAWSSKALALISTMARLPRLVLYASSGRMVTSTHLPGAFSP